MFARARMITVVAGACLVGTVPLAFAQLDAVTQKLTEFKSASQELSEFYLPVEDKAVATGVAAQMDAALKQQETARMALAEAIAEAMKKIDPNNQKDEKQLEGVFAEMQAVDKEVSDAKLSYDESRAAADVKKP
jgi:hypothetical protein